MIDRPSPNFDHRPGGIDMLILHYTGMTDVGEALARLCDPAARVSAHYLIDRDGTLYRLVDEAARAWHAGVSSWAGRRDINGLSIGIELHNPGHEFGYRDFPEPQMVALEDLCRDILARHPIAPGRVLGHADVAPGRKQDPGERFDWRRLAAAGVGLWPDRGTPDKGPALVPGDHGPAVADLQRGLARHGYGIVDDGQYGPLTEQVVAAFQRHFRQRQVDGIADPETRGTLAALLLVT